MNINVTIEREDDSRAINFLDVTFARNDDMTLSSKWYKKPCSLMIVLNYYSCHPWHVKRDVVRQMVRKAFGVTSPRFMSDTKHRLREVLRRSSYPRGYADSVISERDFQKDVVRERIGHGVPGRTKRYVACPYFEPLVRVVRDIISRSGVRFWDTVHGLLFQCGICVTR